MTAHKVKFFQAACHACRRKFSMPVPGDFDYGEFVLHGERSCVFGFLSAHHELAWKDIQTRLERAGLLPGSPSRTDIDRFHQVVAAAADALSGQRLVPFPICPSCGSRSIAYGDSAPGEIGDVRHQDIREIPNVTFNEYQLLSEQQRTDRVRELWIAFENCT